MDALSHRTHDIVAALMQCHTHCSMTASTTLLEGEGDDSPQHIRLVLDAAAISLATADALSRKSQFQSQFALLCADICETCAQTCEKHPATAECAKACRAASKACAGLDVPERAEILAMASRLPPGSSPAG
jgi:hypothetical protein